jgi:hypothetical protein
MQHHVSVSAFLMGALALAACGADSRVTTEPAPHAQLNSRPAPIDVSGSWNWSQVEQLTFPAWVAAEIFGIEPEGPVTTARCEGAGTLNIVQDGQTFTGTSLTTAVSCETSGGQVFVDPLSFIPAAVTGTVSGRSVSFTRDGVVVDCDYHATIRSVEGGTATQLSGGSRCVLPGHPQAEIPADPPPGGTSRALFWSASR